MFGAKVFFNFFPSTCIGGLKSCAGPNPGYVRYVYTCNPRVLGWCMGTPWGRISSPDTPLCPHLCPINLGFGLIYSNSGDLGWYLRSGIWRHRVRLRLAFFWEKYTPHRLSENLWFGGRPPPRSRQRAIYVQHCPIFVYIGIYWRNWLYRDQGKFMPTNDVKIKVPQIDPKNTSTTLMGHDSTHRGVCNNFKILP